LRLITFVSAEPFYLTPVPWAKFNPMKYIYLIFSLHFFAQPFIAQSQKRKVQLVILFDTSNSMDGLLGQAKSKIWSIVNEVSKLRYNNEIPELEIAMYDYGNQSLSIKENYIRQQLNFTRDLDLVSEKLFGLTTNGGDEFCGAVIQKSLEDLAWSTQNSDLKLLYIAGNEPFNQGPVSYKEACVMAKKKGVIISTVFCGSYDEGVRSFWQEGATCSGGDFFNINSDQAITYVATPYDTIIQSYNHRLNGTYVTYGWSGEVRKAKQVKQDDNAGKMNSGVLVERAVAKGSANYVNGDWDLVDALASDSTLLSRLGPEEKSEELAGKTDEEIKQLIKAKASERATIQEEINKLSRQRLDYLQNQAKNNPAQQDDFGTAVSNSLKKNALKLGFEKANE
jgi:hypothetical protein